MAIRAPKLSVLVLGSGIAGPCFAYWLNEFLPNVSITILERTPEPRTGGQAVDLRAASISVVERMGLLSAVKDKTTTEEGIEFVYADGKTKATIPATGDANQQGPTSEYEILRGDLAEILYNATKDTDCIRYVFDETAINIKQDLSDGKVTVTFANHLQPASYDLVVGADGMMSRTRRLVFGHGPRNDDYLYRLGQYGAYFSIPRTEDDSRYAQWYNAPNGRFIFKRPDPYNTFQVYMAVTDGNLKRFDEIEKMMREQDRKEQQAWVEKEFQGAGWQTERMIKGMKESKYFYMQQLAQVKMDKWSEGHVVLVGDSAFCPSPISGMGAGSAIIGAYVLAGEVSKSPQDIPGALERYDAITRVWVNKIQKLIPGAPQIVSPQTEWGISILNHTMGIISHPFVRRFGSLMGKIAPAFAKNEWKLPEYGTDSQM